MTATALSSSSCSSNGSRCSILQPCITASVVLLALLSFSCHAAYVSAKFTSSTPSSILVLGSVNIDLVLAVHRLPGKGETAIARSPTLHTAVGGKGANQAVAAARLSQGTNRSTRFICRFGNDAYAAMLEHELSAAGVDISGCGRAADLPSGHGMVMLEPDGTASSVVVGGSNTAWEKVGSMTHLVHAVGAVLLQREVPEHVNIAMAEAAAAAGVPVIQDMGGEDAPIPDKLLSLVDYLMPNEPELQSATDMDTGTDAQVLAAARSLVKRGAKNVLATLGDRGAVLVTGSGDVLRQAALPVPGGKVVDATAAGDAFRAGFAVALVEGRPLQDCLQFAAAAGALAVSKIGAMPSLPTRVEVDQLIASRGSISASQSGTTTKGTNLDVASHQGLLQQDNAGQDAASSTADGLTEQCSLERSSFSGRTSADAGRSPGVSTTCPYKFASRLNSMKARRDLVTDAHHRNDVLGWIARQGTVQGLDLVDFNYPQHLEGTTTEELLKALHAAKLQTGAVCVRFPAEFRLGAFSNPSMQLRQKAVELAINGCRWAAALGAAELIVWSPYDGYDYYFQVDYHAAWQRTVAAFQALADGCPPGVRASLEFKPTDEATRFAIVPSTGAALLLVREVNRPNFGLTLDVGHLLMAGENPAQSAAMVAAHGKLFGMQLNDAHVKLGAEDGLAFGSVNPTMALELVYNLFRSNYTGHIYFDTFPTKEDPVQEAEYNIRRFKALWAQAVRLSEAGVARFAVTHDAMGALQALEADEMRLR